MGYFTAAILLLAAAGTAVTVYGQRQQAKTAKAMGEYNAKLAENQALQAEMDATETLRRRRTTNDRILATQASRYAKAGVVEEGTPLAVLAETAGILEMENLDMSRQAGQKASYLRQEAMGSRALGANQSRAYNIQAGASLLSGVSQTSSLALQYGDKF